MWSQISYVAQYQGTSPRRAPESGGPEAHSHSPRHQSIQLARPALPIPVGGTMLPPNQVPFPKLTAGFDPFTEPNIGHNQWRQTSFTDVSMPDYSSSESSRRVTDPITAHMFDRRYETMQSVGAYESICEALLPAAPTNTPQNLVEGNGQENPTSNRYPSPMPLDQANGTLWLSRFCRYDTDLVLSQARRIDWSFRSRNHARNDGQYQEQEGEHAEFPKDQRYHLWGRLSKICSAFHVYLWWYQETTCRYACSLQGHRRRRRTTKFPNLKEDFSCKIRNPGYQGWRETGFKWYRT